MDEATLLKKLIAQSNRIVRMGIGAIVFGLVPIGLWLATAPLSSAVIAPGVVKVDLDWHPVQHAEGGIVGEVKVRKGQEVTQGQPLVVLDDVRIDTDFERLRIRIYNERISVERYQAEQSLSSTYRLPEDIATSLDEQLKVTAEREQRLFRLGRRSLDAQLRLLKSQRATVSKEIEALKIQVKQSERALRLQQKELETNVELGSSGFISETRVSQLEASVAELAGRTEEKRSDLERARQRLIDNQLRAQALQSEYRDKASEKLREASARLADLEQEFRRSEDAAERQLITAPISGELIELVVRGKGEIIAPRQPIAYIVPNDSPLVIEAQVRSEDIARVSTGMEVMVQLTALMHLETKQILGKLQYVSADRIEDEKTKQVYYRALVEVNRASLAELGVNRLQPGMPAEIYISGVTRTPLEYLAEPLAQIIRRSARED